ncbi:aspartyl/asparaginyl beta-hydroxylase domain-containing protein [Sphingomonas sp. LB-2]|uniref:aspartyl/asparaginyl beta-hydroxylase domain-containing protein n=1 Tax=Sphingomonas caeni TaxID=2984949 RepID=UPI0022312387|nr:aspartyl/asparaginyl beta-hydroxylase domain-containing protein [Sphingomonas caeni]MCW3847995.1 aspartyl/asparaginyl beta-hydroxylase domain-containing protein [Sphingomonas caeni]
MRVEAGNWDEMWQQAGASRPASLRTLLRGPLDRLIASCSLVATSPVLDVRDFPWTALLRENWRAIRAETEAARQLIVGGKPIEETLSRCPVTASLVHQIPGLVNATVSTLAAGAHIPAHRGATKGLITCHLGLAVPRDGDVRMALANRVLRWAEGETLVFDDSYAHEIWNEAGAPRTVLHLQFRRPMRQPARWLAERLATRR